eukprot:3239595-Heterocapsa_arctica.AAC.1
MFWRSTQGSPCRVTFLVLVEGGPDVAQDVPNRAEESGIIIGIHPTPRMTYSPGEAGSESAQNIGARMGIHPGRGNKLENNEGSQTAGSSCLCFKPWLEPRLS